MVLQLCVLTIFTIVQGRRNVEMLVGTSTGGDMLMWLHNMSFLIGTGLTDLLKYFQDNPHIHITFWGSVMDLGLNLDTTIHF